MFQPQAVEGLATEARIGSSFPAHTATSFKGTESTCSAPAVTSRRNRERNGYISSADGLKFQWP